MSNQLVWFYETIRSPETYLNNLVISYKIHMSIFRVSHHFAVSLYAASNADLVARELLDLFEFVCRQVIFLTAVSTNFRDIRNGYSRTLLLLKYYN